MRDKSHIFRQICHLSSYVREILDDSLMAMPLKSNYFFPYKGKYLNVFERYALSVCWAVSLSVDRGRVTVSMICDFITVEVCLPIKNLHLATGICSKLALEIFDLNYFNFFVPRFEGKEKASVCMDFPRATKPF